MKFKYIAIMTLAVMLLVGCGKEEQKVQNEPVVKVEKEVVYEKLTEKELEVRCLDGDVKAQLELATRYDYGTSEIGHSFEKAKKYYEMAAAQNNVDAIRCLGYLYLNGCGVDKDLDKAMNYFVLAKDAGDVDSWVGIGRVYMTGYGDHESTGEEALTSEQKAKAAIEHAYNAKRPAGLYYMAYLMENEGSDTAEITQDMTSVVELYQSIAILEDLSVYDKYLVDAANTRLGMMYALGKGVTQDYDTAMEYLKKASKNAYPEAQYYIGQMYENGYGVDKDYKEAYEWYVRAAQKDYAPALNQLGSLFYKGNGVDADLDQAIYYHKLAAMQGYAAAQINLGYLYENGIGVERSIDTALAYYQLAAEQNNEGAKEAVARVQRKINEEK